MIYTHVVRKIQVHHITRQDLLLICVQIVITASSRLLLWMDTISECTVISKSMVVLSTLNSVILMST